MERQVTGDPARGGADERDHESEMVNHRPVDMVRRDLGRILECIASCRPTKKKIASDAQILPVIRRVNIEAMTLAFALISL